MALLEIVAGGSETLQVAFAVQRARLREEMEVVTADFIGVPMMQRMTVLKALDNTRDPPDAVLLRGIEMLPEVLAYVPKKVPIFVDHCTPTELGTTSPLRQSLDRVRRVYCYSEHSDTALRRAGFGRVTVVPGPTIPTDGDGTSNGKVTVALLNTSSMSGAVLVRLMKIKKQQEWDFDVVTSLKHSKAKQVANDFEAAEQADLIIAPYEDMDFGQPHDGAIMALAVGRPLVTTRTGAFNVMSFPDKNLLAAKKYQIGSYAAAVGTYLRDRRAYDEWTKDAGPDPCLLPDDLLSRIQ